MKKISIITVCFNAQDTLSQTIKSVLNQTYENIEYIIIDGGSSDRTRDIIQQYANNPKFENRITYWISEPDEGIYDAMNKGIKMVTGEYVNYMNAGDSFVSNDVISKLIYDEADVIYGNAINVFPFGMMRKRPGKKEQISHSMFFCHQACFVKSSLLKKYQFDTHYKIVADYNFFYTLHLLGKSFRYQDLDIVKYEAISGLSTKAKVQSLKEMYEVRGESRFQSFSWWRCRIREVIRNIIPNVLFNKVNRHRLQKLGYELIKE